MFKKVSAVAASVVMAAAMAISASAATYEDAVQAAKDGGVQAHNVQQLETFLVANKDYFTADQYDAMIADLNAVVDKYVKPLATSMYNKAPADLTEDERDALGKKFTEADREAIKKDLIDLGAKYNVTVTVTKSTQNVGFDVSAKIGEVETPVDPPIQPTGAEASSASALPVAGAAAVVLLAGAGIVVVAKKNKEN